MTTQKTIRIYARDSQRLEKVKELWLKSHPEFKGIPITYPFIISKMIDDIVGVDKK